MDYLSQNGCVEKEINANRNADGGYSTEEINSEYIH